MNVSVVLFKKEGTYYSETKKKDVPFTNFFLRVNTGPLVLSNWNVRLILHTMDLRMTAIQPL